MAGPTEPEIRTVTDGTDTASVSTAGADGVSNTANTLDTSSRVNVFNGTTWDRLRSAFTTATSTLTGLGASAVYGIYRSSATALTDLQVSMIALTSRSAVKSVNDELFPGEDTTANVTRVEQQFTGVYCTADTQVKASAGFIHTVTFFSTDAAPTAGTIIIYDNTAESGTIIASFDIPVTTKWNPFTIVLDRVCTTGIYVGFTTTADVTCQVTYR